MRGVMTRYTTRPARPARAMLDSHSLWSDGEVSNAEVYDDGTWSDDQPTGLLDADGDMIYRVRRSIGFLADM